MKWKSRLAMLVGVVGLGACGGGGGGDSPSAPAGDLAVAQQCSPSNPYRADASSATTVGTLASEKRWLRSYFDQAYLWYAEVPTVDATLPAYSVDTAAGYYGSIDDYFDALRTPAIVAGTTRRKDQFSFTFPTQAWNALAQTGVSAGYGIEWSVASPTPPRGIRVAYVEPGSPAAAAGLARGDRLQSVDGVGADDGTTSGVATLNAALSASAAGVTRSFMFGRGATTLPTTSLTSAAITKQPVLVSRVLNVGGRSVGYLVFNDHIATAEAQLVTAIESFRTAAVTELVLDLRYNGGGYLYIASQLAAMIAGPTPTAGRVFERLQYNDKRSAESNAAGASIGFRTTTCDLSSSLNCTSSRSLPSLGLSRVTILASGSTCSASESIVNGLRGVDIDVRLIGTATCGKPYGFTAKDNCGVSYFPIEFQGVNAKGQGDYAGGFSPNCVAADDLDRALGDPSEGQLAAALTLINTGACPPVVPKSGASAKAVDAAEIETRILLRPPTRENRMHLPGLRDVQP
jgi:carboxyl-terminal processing protease